eukprot:2023165-Pyramimonas_sp.AAC.1
MHTRGWRLEAGGWDLEVGGWRLEVGCWGSRSLSLTGPLYWSIQLLPDKAPPCGLRMLSGWY